MTSPRFSQHLSTALLAALASALGAGCSCGGGGVPTVDASIDAAILELTVSAYSHCSSPDSAQPVQWLCGDDVMCLPLDEEFYDQRVYACTVPCSTDADCPTSLGSPGACLPLGLDGASVCYLRCTYGQPGQCFAQQECRYREDGNAYCLIAPS